jgi:hypothetical protein
MSIEKETIHIDFTAPDIPETVKNFRPYIYRDEDNFYCILGTDKEYGVFGTGATVELAMQDWERSLKEKRGK